MKRIFLLFLVLNFSNYTFAQIKNVNKKFSKFYTYINHWQHLDIVQDTVPGVSLDKAYKKLIKKRKGNQVIVAVIDSQMDINHEDLKQAIWINKNEIPNNGIDDDNNGYIDDVNGWNFLGNKNGDNIIFTNTESDRIFKKFKSKYNLTTKKFNGNKSDSLTYSKALIEHEYDLSYIKSLEETSVFFQTTFPKAKKTILKFFPNGNYNLKKIDSLYQKYKLNDNADDETKQHIYFIRDVLKLNLSQEWFDNYEMCFKGQKENTYNPNYYDRKLIGDNDDDLNDKNYGNGNVSKYAKETWHATQVAGIIAANRENEIGIKGFGNQIKIMPITVFGFGYQNDKDVALAIRYAVDNGANVVNMSFYKTSSLHNDWVIDALKYGEQKGVLFVIAAGNDGIDSDKTLTYPNDYTELGKELCNNVVNVSGIGYTFPEFITSWTNYGKLSIDVFAPCEDLYTTDASFGYVTNSGTSLSAAITSGIAALICSHYPKLTPAQIKQILLDSSVKYDLDVQVPGEKEGTLRPFKDLSKSGGVVNAYNALLMAEEISKKK